MNGRERDYITGHRAFKFFGPLQYPIRTCEEKVLRVCISASRSGGAVPLHPGPCYKIFTKSVEKHVEIEVLTEIIRCFQTTCFLFA